MFARIFAYLCAVGDKPRRLLRDPDRSLHPQTPQVSSTVGAAHTTSRGRLRGRPRGVVLSCSRRTSRQKDNTGCQRPASSRKETRTCRSPSTPSPAAPSATRPTAPSTSRASPTRRSTSPRTRSPLPSLRASATSRPPSSWPARITGPDSAPTASRPSPPQLPPLALQA